MANSKSKHVRTRTKLRQHWKKRLKKLKAAKKKAASTPA